LEKTSHRKERILMDRRVVRTHGAPAPIGPYEQGIVVGNLLFTSGQIGLDPATGELVKGGVEEEAKRVFQSLLSLVQEAGGSPPDVVKANLYLKDLSAFGRVNEIYASFFGESPPARTTVEVSALPKGASIEADLVVRIPPR
jgi:2-iminobutanoate/2-iminopropanoate deaminase